METSALFRKLETYLPAHRLKIIDEAYLFSRNAHMGQTRASGKPFIQHPIAVTDILADWRADAPSIISALLHDVVEDTPITLEQIESRFGEEIAKIVDGLSKIERLENIGKGIREAESFRKLLLAAAADWRVIFIKIADRLHNMRTLGAISSLPKRKSIAHETLDIYAPIAGRIGIKTIEDELKNLAFRHIHPQRHRVLSKAVKITIAQSQQEITAIENLIRAKMDAHGIYYTLKKRQKSIHSIHQKMERRNIPFEGVEDIIGFRLIVEDKITCYIAVGIMHEIMVPRLSRFKDFIAIPKSNGYQSLHTGGITQNGLKIDVQIRTKQMDFVAENGLAAHWMYKEEQANTGGEQTTQAQAEAIKQLSSLVQLHNENASPGEFMKNVKTDLFPDEMYVLTPKAKIITLPRGATALDMAYAIHTEVGKHAARAVINGKVMPIFYELKSGDQIKIITNPTTHPMPHWLKYTKTARARSSIRHSLQNVKVKESITVGKSLLISALNRLDPNTTLDDIKESNWHSLLAGQSMADKETLYQTIGIGKILPDIVAHSLLKKQIKQNKTKRGSDKTNAIPIVGAGSSSIDFPACCYAIPEEPIVGILTKTKGLEIHANHCSQITADKKISERWIDVQWSADAKNQLHRTTIHLNCHNRTGLIFDITGQVNNLGINIVDFHLDDGDMQEEFIKSTITIEVYDLEHLQCCLDAIQKIDDVLEVWRGNKK